MTAGFVKEDMYTVVYNHLVQMYQHIYMSIFEYLTMEHQALISYDAYAEMIAMAQGGYLKDYYERLKRGAV